MTKQRIEELEERRQALQDEIVAINEEIEFYDNLVYTELVERKSLELGVDLRHFEMSCTQYLVDIFYKPYPHAINRVYYAGAKMRISSILETGIHFYPASQENTSRETMYISYEKLKEILETVQE